MADARFTLNGLAEQIAHATDDTTGAAEYWSRIFRTLHTLNLLPAATYYGKGRTATALYDEAGLCLARIVAALIEDVKWEIRVVREVLTSLPKARPDRTVANAIAGIRAGENWSFRIAVIDRKSGPEMRADFQRDGDDDRASKAIVDNAAGSKRVGVLLYDIVIPCNRLFVPLLDD